MEKRFLITTALRNSFIEDKSPILLLGEWCRLYKQRKKWSEFDFKILPYHWDDRIKLYQDYKYLEIIREKLLIDIAEQLNKIHGVNHSIRYWRIFIGPWLGYFSAILFDRWSSIMQAISQFEITGTKIVLLNHEEMIPNDMQDFVTMFIGDRWNHYIYGEIIKRFTSIQYTNVVDLTNNDSFRNIETRRTGILNKAKLYLRAGYSSVISFFVGSRDSLFMSTYLPKASEIKLQICFRQIPYLPHEPISPQNITVDMEKRNWSLPKGGGTEFEKILRCLISMQLPKVYLEGYDRLKKITSVFSWPSSPKFILTSNSHIGNDSFKEWAASKVEKGSLLFIGQHGGHYGIGKWNFNEDHEIAICDKYLTWGWNDKNTSKIIPVGQLSFKPFKKNDHSKKCQALLVLTSMPRYSYWMFSACVSATQYNAYVDDSFSFVANLSPRIQKCLTVRLLKHDFDCNQVERWHDKYPDIQLDKGFTKISRLVNESKIFISTYNATTFLESLTLNIPTVIFWNPDHWELRDSAVPFFENLKKARIFHTNPVSAAQHINAVWDDVNTWWFSEEVQLIKQDFCEKYSHSPNSLINRLVVAINSTLAKS